MNNSKRSAVAPETYDRDMMLVLWHREQYRSFLESGGAVLRPRVEHSLYYGQIGEGTRVLDVGCGRGEVVSRVSHAGAVAIGIDYSHDCVSLAKETLAKMGQGGHLAVADAAHLPFPDEVFDRIFILDVIEHLHEPHAISMLNGLKRVLHPRGYIVVHTLPNRWALSLGYKLLRLVFRSLPEDPRLDVDKVVHVNEQDILTLHRIMNQAGLASHIWLEGTIAEQAGWESNAEYGHSARRTTFGLLRRPFVSRLYHLAMRSPLRLLFANDIYAIAWRQEVPCPVSFQPRVPPALCERAILRSFSWLSR